jgi:hypothetical protein
MVFSSALVSTSFWSGRACWQESAALSALRAVGMIGEQVKAAKA